MKKILEKLKAADTIVWFLLIYTVGCFLLVPNFGTAYNIKNILSQVCVALIVACGVTYPVLNGGTDFSVTSIIALSGVVGARIMNQTDGWMAGSPYAVPVAILAMLAIGIVFGTINGLSVVFLKMPSYIVTMATQMIGSGLAIMTTMSRTIGNFPDGFCKFGTGSFFKLIPYTFLFSLGVVIVTHFILRRTRLGREIYVVGTNPQTARISGIDVKKTIFKLYIMSGLCGSLGGIVMIAQMESAAPSFASNMFIDFMSAIIIGGANPGGGRGKITGTLMGAFLIIMINVSLNLLAVDWYVISIIKGVIVLASAAAQLSRAKGARA